MTAPRLEVRCLHHAYGPTEVLARIDLAMPAGRTVALVGPSGCGKTTLLHLCAGLLPLQQGHLASTFDRSAVMFQQPRLLPWLNTLDNIALGLKARGWGRHDRRARARTTAESLGLEAQALACYPAALSGGMQSRAALARALVLEPDVLWMDEPFSALDIGLRGQLHQLLLERQAHAGTAVLLITHDVMEAVRLAHTVAVMAPSPGRIVALFEPAGTPQARSEAQVHRSAGELLSHAAVRQAFGLPQDHLVASEAEEAVPDTKVAGGWLQQFLESGRPVCRGAGTC